MLECAHSLDTIQCYCCLLGPRVTCSEINELRFAIGAHALVEVLKVEGGTRRSVDGLTKVLRLLLRLASV